MIMWLVVFEPMGFKSCFNEYDRSLDHIVTRHEVDKLAKLLDKLANVNLPFARFDIRGKHFETLKNSRPSRRGECVGAISTGHAAD
jgi:hypothetical protein